MSEAPFQQQISAPITSSGEDSADEYVVIEQEEEADIDKSPSLSEALASNHSAPSEAQSVASPADTVADIGNGLDGHKLSVSSIPRTAMSDSNYSQNIFNSSIFGPFMIEDQLRELVRSENEQNRQMLDSIKSTLGELTKHKQNNSDCEINEHINQHKKSLEQALKKLDLSKELNREKDKTIVALEQKVEQLVKTLDASTDKTAQLEEELANKDEIISVLREEIDEQRRVNDTRVKVWRERIDSLEQMLISQQERAEVNNCG